MDGLAIDAARIVVELVAVAEIAPHADSVLSRKPPWNSYELTTTASASRAARSPSRERVRLRQRARDETEHAARSPPG